MDWCIVLMEMPLGRFEECWPLPTESLPELPYIVNQTLTLWPINSAVLTSLLLLHLSSSLIFFDRSWFINIPFVGMVKLKSFALFPVSHLSPSVMPCLVFLLYSFVAFSYIINYYFIPYEFFIQAFAGGLSLESEELQVSQVSRTLLSILADYYYL